MKDIFQDTFENSTCSRYGINFPVKRFERHKTKKKQIKVYIMLYNRLHEREYHACELLYYMYFIDSLYYFISNIFTANITNTPNLSKQLLRKDERM